MKSLPFGGLFSYSAIKSGFERESTDLSGQLYPKLVLN